MASEAGKGSRRRQPQISQKEVDDNWDKIFKKEPIKLTKEEACSIETIEALIEIHKEKRKSRMDIIGQNGNDGVHYDSDDNVDRWSAVLRDEYDTKYWKDQ